MNIARKIYYSLTPSLRFIARRLFYLPVDFYETAFQKRDKMIPPRGLIFIGSGDFVKQGEHLSNLVIEQTHLQPDGNILDVGCGIGRLAVPLTRYLSPEGEYEGFDIVKKGIDWCRQKITPRFPNFHFLYIDLKNDLYNLSTDAEAGNFIFPYPQNHFDCVVLTSVFTHMMPADVRNYLDQIAKVMKNEGRCLATFFLLNPEVNRLMQAGKIPFRFPHSFNGYSLMDKKVKEANVAFEETLLFSMLDKSGLRAESVHRGRWSNGKAPLDFQDVVVIRKV